MRVRFLRDVAFHGHTIRAKTVAHAVPHDGGGWTVQMDDGSFVCVEVGVDVVVDCACVCHHGSAMMHFVACC